jgi:hypothetical protein
MNHGAWRKLIMIKELNKFPKEKHYAALVFDTRYIHHEGDERSRTNPGHGYPAYTETIKTVDYIVFESKGEMELWITGQHKLNKTNYQIIEAAPLTVKTSVSVQVSH